MLVGFRKIIDGATCNATATVYSLVTEDNPFKATNSWIDTSLQEAFSLWVNVASATGTGNVTVYADVSPLTPQEHAMAYTATSTQYYKSFTLGTIITDNALAMYTTNDLVDIVYTPFRSMRIRVVGTASNPTDTVVDAYLVTSATRI